jgi:DNA polymerase III alpha subunit
MFTDLKDRRLWFDGEVSTTAIALPTALSKRPIKWVHDVVTPDVEAYNKLQPREKRIGLKQSCGTIKTDWLPDVSSITWQDVEDYVFARHDAITTGMDSAERAKREERLANEYITFSKNPTYQMMLKTMLFVVLTLEDQKVTWGVGRGSSVSSYLLYVMGVHDIDSFEYDLQLSDFIS